jgi:hypothetical protein
MMDDFEIQISNPQHLNQMGMPARIESFAMYLSDV